jgi:hypothetical protein
MAVNTCAPEAWPACILFWSQCVVYAEGIDLRFYAFLSTRNFGYTRVCCITKQMWKKRIKPYILKGHYRPNRKFLLPVKTIMLWNVGVSGKHRATSRVLRSIKRWTWQVKTNNVLFCRLLTANLHGSLSVINAD